METRPKELITQPLAELSRDWQKCGCPVCGSRALTEILTLRNVPAQDGVLWETAQDARRAPTGDIQLMLCTDCGYIGNQLHDPSKVRFTGYDVSLQHSPIFREFTERLALKLITRYDLRAKTVLDIGCGQGHFLSTLCRLGANTGIGFDPSYAGGNDGQHAPSGLSFIRDYYSEAYAGIEAEMISCRHVIDILGDPVSFLRMLRQNIGSERTPLVYFESPDASYTISQKILWNLVYEHKSWFTLESYRALFERSGFEVLEVSRCWNDEYLGIEAIPAKHPTIIGAHTENAAFAGPSTASCEAIEALAAQCRAFACEYTSTLSFWRTRLRQLSSEGKRVALWGSGARGISFLNFFQAENPIAAVADINPKRQGKFLPGCALCVTSPERLMASEAPDIVIISNPTYEAEIRQQARALGYRGEFLVL